MGLALALAGGLALAQDTVVKKPRRPQPPAATTSTAGVAPGLPGLDGIDAASGAGAAGLPGMAPPPVLRSAVRSRWNRPATIASQGGAECRAQCATTRIACLAPQVVEEAPRCNAQWTSCLSACDGLTYGRAGAP